MRHIKDILRDSCDELTYIVAETYGEEAKKETRQAAISARKDIAAALEREQSRLQKLKRRSVDEKHDGWANYATRRVSLEIFDERPEEWEEVTADDCKDYAEMLVDNGSTEGFALDYALAFLQDVNWQEIAEHLNENA